ncbi:MAG: hypothetical protein LBH68_04325 [Bifidobacteriaceae bacterium]|nr:hypothetical protein [Bifidobacteriaceae bacterium]
MTLARRRFAAPLGAALVLLVSACTGGGSGGDEVATLEDPGGKDQPAVAPTQGETAEAMATCLTRGGLPAAAKPLDDGRTGSDVVIETDQPYMAQIHGSLAMSPGEKGAPGNEEALKAMGELAAQYGSGGSPMNVAGLDQAVSVPTAADQSFLVVGAADYTDLFVGCLEETGYTAPGAADTSAEELAEKRHDLEATLAWAECGRQHGFAGITDPAPPVADGYTTFPTALLPASITAPELAGLLADCPSFEPAGWDTMEEAVEDLGANASDAERQRVRDELRPARPRIGFDAPGFNGHSEELPSPDDQDHFGPLMDLITLAERQYWADRAGVPLGTGVG